jgi:hypothetical protein
MHPAASHHPGDLGRSIWGSGQLQLDLGMRCTRIIGILVISRRNVPMR